MLKQKTNTTFHIAVKIIDDGVIVTRFIGPAYHSKLQLKKSLARIRRKIPDASAGRFVSDY